MKILILGLGVIGTIYGHALKEAGHEVQHLVRDSQINNLPSRLNINILDGRNNKKGSEYKCEYEVIQAEANATFDFILISVASGKIKAAFEFVKSKKIEGTVLLFCNFWYTRKEIENIFCSHPYIIGFPVAGGALNNGKLDCVIFDHIMLEQENKSNIPNYKNLEILFRSAQIELEKPYDMVEWIWLHMAINAAVTANAVAKNKNSSSFEMTSNLMNSSNALSEVVITVRETIKIVKLRGVNLKKYNKELLPYKIPARIAGLFMKKMFQKNELTRRIMFLHNDMSDIGYGIFCVYHTGKELHANAPLFYQKSEIAFDLLNQKVLA